MIRICGFDFISATWPCKEKQAAHCVEVFLSSSITQEGFVSAQNAMKCGYCSYAHSSDRNTVLKSTPLLKGISRGKFSEAKTHCPPPTKIKTGCQAKLSSTIPSVPTEDQFLKPSAFMYDLVLSSQQSHMGNHISPIS